MSENGYQRGNEARWIRRLVGYCWRFKRDVIIALIGALLYTAATLSIPLLQRAVIDNVIVKHTESVWPLAAGLLVAAVANFFGVYMRRYRGGKMALDVQHEMRTELFESLSNLDGARQDEIHTGQLVGRSISDVNMVQQLLQWMPLILGSGILFIFSIVIMIILSPLLSLVAIAVAPALWLIAVASRKKLFPASWQAQQVVGDVAGIVDESIGGVRVVKGFGQEEQEMERLEGTSRFLFGSRLRMVRLTARYNPALTAIPSFGLVGVLLLGGWLAIRGNITLGTFLAFSSYLAQLAGPVRVITNLVTIGQEARASVIRVFEVIDSKPTITDKPDAIELPADANGILFDDVQFGYVPSQPVLRGLTLEVRPGETVAVIGPSGSGKSTLSLLLPRFYDVRGGAVRIGGYDVRDVTQQSLRASIGMVMEESFLFSDSVQRQYRLRTTGRHRGADPRRGQGGRGRRVHPRAARGLRQHRRRAGTHALRRPAAAGRPCPGADHRPPAAAARRRDLRGRPPDRGGDPRHPAPGDGGPDHAAYRAPQVHPQPGRPDRGHDRRRPAGRRRHRRRADRALRALPGADHRSRRGRRGDRRGRPARCGPRERGRRQRVGADRRFRRRRRQRSWEWQGEVQGPFDIRGFRAGGGASARCLRGHRRRSAGRCGRRSRRGRGRGAGGRGSAMDGMIGSVPPSPELLAKVEALPPIKDEPNVELAAARASDHNFTLKKLLKPIALALIFGLVLDGLDAAAGLALPALVRGGIDSGVQAKAFHYVILVSMIGLAIVFADWIVNIVETMVVGRNGERLLYTLRVKLFAQLQRLGLDFYERELNGRIMTRMTSDVDALSSFLQTGLVTMVSSLLTFVGVLAAMLVINLELGLLVLAIMPVLAVATVIFRRKSSQAYTEARERISVVNADLAENVAGLRVTQAFRREGTNRNRFAGRSDLYRQSRLRAQRYISLYFPFVQTLLTVASALVLVVAVGQVRSGALSVGALIAYLLYIDMVFSPIQSLSQVFDGYQQAAVGLQRIKDLLRLSTSTPPPAVPVPVPASGLTGLIELRDVHFAYTTGSELSGGAASSGKAGEAIAGRVLYGDAGRDGGAGRPDRGGQVHDRQADGAVLRRHRRRGAGGRRGRAELRPHRVPQRLGVVPQEAYLFSGTVAEAIAYARPSASDAEVEAAARAVGAHEMITHLPDGYAHEVGDGAGTSRPGSGS